MKVAQNPRETRDCVARVGLERTRQAPRKRSRCGAAALDFGDVRIAGRLVEIPLCRLHFRMLRDSADPVALAREWAVESGGTPAPEPAAGRGGDVRNRMA